MDCSCLVEKWVCFYHHSPPNYSNPTPYDSLMQTFCCLKVETLLQKRDKWPLMLFQLDDLCFITRMCSCHTVMLQECVSMWGFSQSRPLLVDAALHWWPSVAPVLLLQLASLLWWQWLHSNKWDVCLFSVGLEKVWKILNFLLLEQVYLFLDKVFTLKMSSCCCCWDNSKVVSLKTRILSNLRQIH